MADNNQNIGSFIPVDDLAQRWQKPEEYQGITLILKSATFNRGKRGEYYVIQCEVEDTKQIVLISTGAGQPKMVIDAWIQNGSRPVRFCFTVDGNRTLITNPRNDMPSTPF